MHFDYGYPYGKDWFGECGVDAASFNLTPYYVEKQLCYGLTIFTFFS